MEIITNALNKLEIETTHSSSEEVEEEVRRNWLELPPDVVSLIFLKMATVDILASAQWVCTSWWKLSKQPHLFRSIHVDEVSTIFGRLVFSYMKLSRGMAREAIDRSCGQLEKFSVRSIADDELLKYMSEKSISLRSLRLVEVALANESYDSDDYFVAPEDGFLQEVAEKLPHLEELRIIKCFNFSKNVIETFGRFCPRIKLCRLNCVSCSWDETKIEGVALAIAENMPELCHLNLCRNLMTDDELKAILDGCPHLESLDLRRCLGLNFGGDLKEMCKNMKVLRLPSDPTDDFEYDSEFEYCKSSSDETPDYGNDRCADHWDGYISD